MAGGFDSMSHREAVRLVLCTGPRMGDALLKCKNDSSQSGASVVLRCMKTACNRISKQAEGFSFVWELQSTFFMFSQIRTLHTATLVLIKGIKCCCDSQGAHR